MVAVNEPLGQVQAFRYRIAKLDTNGVPTPGASNSYVSSGVVSLLVSPQYKDGTHIEQENGEGVLCVSYDGPDSLLRVDFTLTICTPDPYALDLLVEGSKLVASAGQGAGGATADADRPYGWAMPAIGTLTLERLSLELWTKRIDPGGDLDPEYPYAWHVLPLTMRRRTTDTTLANGAVVPVVTGKAYTNNNWFDGPHEDYPGTSDRPYQWIPCKESEVPAASVAYVATSTS
jgi:hypothetical protein